MTLLASVLLATADRLTVAGLMVCGFLLGGMLCRPVGEHLEQLPLMSHLQPVLGSLAGLGLVAVVEPEAWGAVGMLLPAIAVVGSVLIDVPLGRRYRRVRRIALVGPDPTAQAVAAEIAQNRSRFELVGRVSVGPADGEREVEVLGSIDLMAQIVMKHRIDLLVLSPEIPRLPVFETVAESCLTLPVRLVDLNSFCERVFGHVPVRSINGAWFQYLMHPRFRARPHAMKRVLDVAIAGALGLVLTPVLAISALLIRRDGGKALFVQTRIGEGGRPFRIYKLRTMSPGSDGTSGWTAPDDPRVTRIGRFLRRTHLDEMPQLINVLRGDMSIVGPRPEQPQYVAALERAIPYYSRRHLMKPGITGWAQVRCGYAGSVEGSAWKLCHDLYYVKHRSLALDMIILGETIRTFFADRQYSSPPAAPVSVPTTTAAPEGLLAIS